MKVKELIKALVEYPEYEIKCIFADTSRCSYEQLYPTYHKLDIDDVESVSHMEKVITLSAI